MNTRRRPKQVKFYVSDEELQLIDKRFKSANMTNKGAYLRKMAIDGYIVNVDTTDLKAAVKEMNAIGRNINQIVHKANTYGISQSAVNDIQSKVDEIWQLLKSTLSNALSASQ